MTAETLSIIEKVKRLLSLSKSPANINEANAALNAANRLIDEHRLSMADFETVADPIIKDDEPVYSSGRVTAWKRTLGLTISVHYGVVFFLIKGYRSNKYILIGRKSDIEIVKYMYAWLVNEADRLSNVETKKLSHSKSEGKIFCNSYCEGFVSGIKEQLAKSSKEAQKTATSSAIVKINQRYDEANSSLDKFFPKHRTIQNVSRSQFNRDAFYNGKEQGKNIHLGASLNKASGVKLLGN